MAIFRITYREVNTAGTSTETIDSDRYADVGDWIEFRSSSSDGTAIQILRVRAAAVDRFDAIAIPAG